VPTCYLVRVNPGSSPTMDGLSVHYNDTQQRGVEKISVPQSGATLCFVRDNNGSSVKNFKIGMKPCEPPIRCTGQKWDDQQQFSVNVAPPGIERSYSLILTADDPQGRREHVGDSTLLGGRPIIRESRSPELILGSLVTLLAVLGYAYWRWQRRRRSD